MKIFSSKIRPLLGVDVSATSLKMVEVVHQQGRYHLKSYGIQELDQGVILDGNIVDSEAVGSAVSSLTKKMGTKSKEAAVAVSGAAVITKQIDMDANLTDTAREIQIRLDADQYIPYPLTEVNLDFKVIGPSPIDLNKVQVLLAASRSENVDQRVDALVFGGLQTKVVDIESHATERAYNLICDNLPDYPKTVALIDIGHEHTTLYIAKDGEFVYSREQLFGGAQLTESIQNKYGLSFKEATQSKHRQTLPADYRHEIFMPFIDSFIQQVNRSLQFYFSSSHETKIDHILLSGGSAALPDMSFIVQHKLDIPVSKADPFCNMTIDDSIDKDKLASDAPSLMKACGLALRSHH